MEDAAHSGLFLAGLAIWFVTSLDFVVVTIGATTRFTLTNWIGRGVFEGLRQIARLGGQRFLTAISGVVVISAVAAFWIIGTWLGWTLIYAGAERALDLQTRGAEAEGADIASHTGHLLSTLGGARTVPVGPVWGLAGVLVGVNGMIVLTLSVSFFLSVRQTVQQGRAFAALRDSDALGDDGAPERVADLVAGLHAAPFALWYGTPRAERQLPAALVAHAEAIEARGGHHWACIRTILADLPHLHLRGDPGLEDLRRWAQRHTIAELRNDRLRPATS